MDREQKLIARFLSTYHQNLSTTRWLNYPGFDFEEAKTGKKTGFKVKYLNPEGVPIMLHITHPSSFKKHYQLKQIK